MQIEANWSALKSIADQANGNAKMALVLAEAMKTCNMQGMFYAPGTSGADTTTGCKELAPRLSKLDIKTHTTNMCKTGYGPYIITAKCASDEELLACAGGPGDQEEKEEYWILLPDYKNKSCTGYAQQTYCHPKWPYAQVIVQAICYKP